MSETFDASAMLRGLQRTLVEFHGLAREQTHALADEAAEMMRANVHVESGKTKAAIGVKEEADYFAVGVVNPEGLDDPNIPFYEEFGTTEMEPRPFGRPAINRIRS